MRQESQGVALSYVPMPIVILPNANAQDLERVPREVLDALDIRLVSTTIKALKAARI